MIKKNILYLCLTFCSLVSEKPAHISDERGWIEKNYLPSLHGSVLYIGVGPYTTHYYTRVQNPELFETIDIVEERAQYGSPFKHHIGNFMLLPETKRYDHVSFFGILGFNPPHFFSFDTKEQMLNALDKVDSLVSTGGTLQVSGQIGGTPYVIEGVDANFWVELFDAALAQKYTTIAYVVSPQNVIWWGKKINN